ncbi:glycoside hydrolase family protein [Pontiella sulfatireligans]|uniref:Iota-carrageenase n=1 Tax=Pontiella sulfatireligans TaxID=2750658 RepID=A0A6C2UD31_9BACT|nr:hypothetical protein [Pontiella sulfatireligans]VGO18098.1 Iota-carrageenase [Pontiella sulfatireligans]
MKYIKHIVLSVLIASCSYAAYMPPDSYTAPSTTIILGSSGYQMDADDDSLGFQKAIDDVHANGGGHVVVPAGEYRVTGLVLKSEVHLIFENGVSLHLPIEGPKKMSTIMFSIGAKGSRANNVSVSSRNEWAEIYLPLSEKGLRVAALSNVENFWISGLTIHDSRTVFSSLIFVWSGEEDGVALLPKHGLIENIVAKNAHYGYGALQVHAGNDLHFRNITAIGGVATRLETGLPQMNLAAFGKPRGYIGLDDIAVEDTTSVNGQAALMMEAHTVKHGTVVARDIKADGSEFAVHLSGGFVSKRKYTADQKYMTIDPGELTPGDFESITIEGVTATYRDHDIVTRFVHFKDYPEELHGKITQIGRSLYGEPGSRGPSIAAVSIPDVNDPAVKVTHVTANGFKYHPDIISHKNQYTGSLQSLSKKAKIENAPDLPWAGADVAFDGPLLHKPSASMGKVYAGTLADTALYKGKSDKQLKYSKLFGPDWLSVSADGRLRGKPVRSDSGENIFTVKVDRGMSGFDIAKLHITVGVGK